MVDNEKKKIENAINFYMLANNLKYITDINESIADRIYGAMILATAINSEYNLTDELSKVIRTILLSKMYNYNRDGMEIFLKQKHKYTHEIYDYYWEQTSDGHLANECVRLENELAAFFYKIDNENFDINDYSKVYDLANEHGVFDRIGKNEKNREIFRFYYINRILKRKLRSGWDSTHWNVSCNRIERISEHCVGTIALAIALRSEFEFDIDLDKIIQMLVNHEIGEIFIGDITPFDGITSEQKKELEHSAMKKAVGNLLDGDKILEMLYEFDEQKTEDAKYAHYCDKLEADIQAKVYQDMGCHHPLTEQQNNVVFKSDKVQKMVQDGATTAFDIWYEWDKSIYTEEPVFTKVLKYVKDNNIKN